MSNKRKKYFSFMNWRCVVATILLLFAGFAILSFVIGLYIYPFLSEHNPRERGILVIEGWLSDDALEEAAKHIEAHSYGQIILTGHFINRGRYLGEYKTTSEVSIHTLEYLGIERDRMLGIPNPYASRDRTFTSALLIKSWMEKHGIEERTIDVFSVGPHARRSRKLFQLAFGSDYDIGVYSCPSVYYNIDNWWKCSSGVRVVLDEAIAWLYIKTFFRPFPITVYSTYRNWLP
ncbi:MAG: hypothetical protein K8S56_09330 [Candidatus Cloacimonetes bacterium]|nr:hypothetical protein [Candidatus Cloacimonadota bacterium]